MNMMQTISQEFSCLSTLLKTIGRNLKNEKFESEVFVLDRFLSEGSVALDIGAAYGRYAYRMSALVGDSGRIYCFEPGDYSHKVLRGIIRFHQLKNIVSVKKAASDAEGTAALTIPVKKKNKLGPSLAHLATGKDPEGIVQGGVAMTTIDRFVEQTGIKQVDFIKCDVEGAEMRAFTGAKAALERFKPPVLSEVDETHLNKFGSSRKQLLEFFRKLGYQPFRLTDNTFQRIESLDEDHNYFFFHPQRTGPDGLAIRK